MTAHFESVQNAATFPDAFDVAALNVPLKAREFMRAYSAELLTANPVEKKSLFF